MSRPDQSITFLKQFGYSVFRVPRASAQPLEVLDRNGKDLTRLSRSRSDYQSLPPPSVHPTINRAWTSKGPKHRR